MSSTPSSSKSNDAANKTTEKSAEPEAHLGVLEEDDEFEEFEVSDWNDDATDLAHLAGATPGGAKSGGDKLWEDNWDDDDIEEEFSLQLRGELAKKDSNAMQH